MKKRLALKIILGIAIAGMLFSGYLSYTELFAGYCGATKLGMGTCTNVAGIPACFYGFIMYLAVFVISALGLRSSEPQVRPEYIEKLKKIRKGKYAEYNSIGQLRKKI